MQVALAQVERLGSAEAVAALRELAAAAAPAGVPLELRAEKSTFARGGHEAIAALNSNPRLTLTYGLPLT